MPVSNEEMDKGLQDQYNAAFDETGEAPAAQSDDEAFGIHPPEEAVAAAEGADDPAEAVATEPEAVVAEDVSGDQAKHDEIVAEPGEDMEYPTDPKELQRVKSWEGRLKKLESELKAKSATPEAAADVIEEVGQVAHDDQEHELGTAANEVAEQVEDGVMTLDQAMKQLAEDFGEPFVKMIEAIAGAKAADISGKATSGVQQEVKDIITHISDSAEKTHFETIASAHADFNDIRSSPEFEAFIAKDPDGQRIAQGGNAREVIKMIDKFKADGAKAAVVEEVVAPKAPVAAPSDPGQTDPEGADAAAGVRSGGLRIPESPADASDYESAWNEASNKR